MYELILIGDNPIALQICEYKEYAFLFSCEGCKFFIFIHLLETDVVKTIDTLVEGINLSINSIRNILAMF